MTRPGAWAGATLALVAPEDTAHGFGRSAALRLQGVAVDIGRDQDAGVAEPAGYDLQGSSGLPLLARDAM